MPKIINTSRETLPAEYTLHDQKFAFMAGPGVFSIPEGAVLTEQPNLSDYKPQIYTPPSVNEAPSLANEPVEVKDPANVVEELAAAPVTSKTTTTSKMGSPK